MYKLHAHSHAHVRMYAYILRTYACTHTPLLLRIGRIEPCTSTSGPPSRNTISKEQSTSRQRLLTIPSHKEDRKLGGTAWTNQLVPARLEGIFSSVAPGNMISKHLWSWSWTLRPLPSSLYRKLMCDWAVWGREGGLHSYHFSRDSSKKSFKKDYNNNCDK